MYIGMKCKNQEFSWICDLIGSNVRISNALEEPVQISKRFKCSRDHGIVVAHSRTCVENGVIQYNVNKIGKLIPI